MINVSDEKRYAFTVRLRTGRLPPAHRADGLEFKFNPYHDPRDGRFTFAPGGPRTQVELGSGYAGSQSRSVRLPQIREALARLCRKSRRRHCGPYRQRGLQ